MHTEYIAVRDHWEFALEKQHLIIMLISAWIKLAHARPHTVRAPRQLFSPVWKEKIGGCSTIGISGTDAKAKLQMNRLSTPLWVCNVIQLCYSSIKLTLKWGWNKWIICQHKQTPSSCTITKRSELGSRIWMVDGWKYERRNEIGLRRRLGDM